MIEVKDMVQTMRKTGANGRNRPFSLVLVTADRQRNTGGRILEFPKATLLTKKRQTERILNIQPVGTKTAVRIHLDLILYFNNLEVI